MIYMELFLTFFRIGLFTFGGGYAMISIIREAVLSHGWMPEEELINFIAVSESTPGPIAVNMATFIGSSQGGLAGAICATLGVVLPSFIIILIIASLVSNLLKYRISIAFLKGIRPCIVALILSTAILMGLSGLLSFSSISDTIIPDSRGIIIFLILLLLHLVLNLRLKMSPSPIWMILLSAVLGIVFYA